MSSEPLPLRIDSPASMAVEFAIMLIMRLRADSQSLRNGFVLARDYIFIDVLLLCKDALHVRRQLPCPVGDKLNAVSSLH